MHAVSGVSAYLNADGHLANTPTGLTAAGDIARSRLIMLYLLTCEHNMWWGIREIQYTIRDPVFAGKKEPRTINSDYRRHGGVNNSGE